MSAVDYYRYLRRRIEKCSCVDSLYVVWAYSQFLQLRNFNFPADIGKPGTFVARQPSAASIHEWELEILAREAILHATKATKSLRDWETLRGIIDRLRSLENELYIERGADPSDVFNELTRIGHRQFPWQGQRPQLSLCNRYFRIFSDPEIDACCRRRL